ncbi:MAG: hypothetical protein IJ057_04465 [Bacteroidales bacterium]|nr:hypothetical protein [Bacteroidales bacterium]
MKKATILTLLVLAVGMAPQSGKAQIFLTDEDMINSVRVESQQDELPIIAQLDVTTDQYAPIGGGIVVLGTLGGAYLVGKKRKER